MTLADFVLPAVALGGMAACYLLGEHNGALRERIKWQQRVAPLAVAHATLVHSLHVAGRRSSDQEHVN